MSRRAAHPVNYVTARSLLGRVFRASCFHLLLKHKQKGIGVENGKASCVFSPLSRVGYLERLQIGSLHFLLLLLVGSENVPRLHVGPFVLERFASLQTCRVRALPSVFIDWPQANLSRSKKKNKK